MKLVGMESGRGTPVVVVLAGVPESGKTTLARELITRTGMWYLSRDDIRARVSPLSTNGLGHEMPAVAVGA
jgi:adenylate kinase family enzyme